MKKKPTVSIIIPTKNSAHFLDTCLKYIRKQTYSPIEIIVVDSKSTDNIKEVVKKYRAKLLTYIPKVAKGIFDAPHKRNYGMERAKGKYVYWLDADMHLPKGLIAEAVSLCEKGADALVLPEDSFGEGIWSQVKQLERRCYWHDSTMESPRFYRKEVWLDIDGFDLSLGAGGDDVDLTQKLLEKNYKIGRTKSVVRHNEGRLTILGTVRKHFMYGREMTGYLRKRPQSWLASYTPFKPAYFRNWRIWISHPVEAMLFIFLRGSEYVAGFAGLLYSLYQKGDQVKVKQTKVVTDYADYLFQYYSTTVPPLLAECLKLIPHQNLLDYGCGDGALLYALKAQGFLKKLQVYAIDISPTSVALVKKIDRRFRAYVDDAENCTKIKSNSVEFATSTMVIEHVDDHKFLRSLSKLMKKGGTVYLTTVFKKPYAWYYNRRDGHWVIDVTHLREYGDDAELLPLIKRHGFEVLLSRKTLMWFPLADFFTRRLRLKNRDLFLNSALFKFIRKLNIPIIGYYEWELILRRR